MFDNETHWELVVAQLFHDAAEGGLEEELGSVDGFGWYGLIEDDEGTWYVISDDEQGFRTAVPYDSKAEAQEQWDNLHKSYVDWCGDVEHD